MKLSRIIFPLTLALVAALATTGCKHKGPVKTTLLPQPAETGGSTTPPLNPGGIGLQTPKPDVGQGLPEWPIENTNIEKLAAYTVHFKYDSAVVEDSEQANLTAVSDALKSDATAKLLIAGHCDERGTEEYNRSLGERRALALREALGKTGIDTMRIRTISYGKDQPADTGHNEAAWAKNRRGQFIWCTPKNAVQ